MTAGERDDDRQRRERGKPTRAVASSEIWDAVATAAKLKPAVPPSHPPEYLALLAKQDWKNLSRRLVKWIFDSNRRITIHDAEDISQTTISRLFEPTRDRWDPAILPDIFHYLRHVARGEIKNWFRSLHRKPTRPYDHEALEDFEEKGPSKAFDRSTETELAAREHAALAISRLEKRIVDDLGCREILTLEREGVEEREEQMEILDKPLEYVKNARRRLRNHLLIVLAELGEETDRRD